jgi:hypothetical protein
VENGSWAGGSGAAADAAGTTIANPRAAPTTARRTAETHVIADLLTDIASPPTAVLVGNYRVPSDRASQLVP